MLKSLRMRFILPRDKILLGLGILVIFSVVSVICTNQAYADVKIDLGPAPGFPDVVGMAEYAFKGLFAGIAEGMFNNATAHIGDIMAESGLTKSFTNLFGGQVYQMVVSINNGVLKNIAAALLGLVAMLQFIKISQKMDGNSIVPAFKDIFFLFVFVSAFIWLINNNLVIVGGIYDLINELVKSITPGQGLSDVKMVISGADGLGIDSLIMLVVAGAITWVVMFAAQLITTFMVMARSLQIYLMAALAPIPLTMLAFDETKSFGISFLKNFAAICLSGVIIAAILAFTPLIMAATVSSMAIDAPVPGSAFASIIPLLCIGLLICMGVIKSGTFAREVLGG